VYLFGYVLDKKRHKGRMRGREGGGRGKKNPAVYILTYRDINMSFKLLPTHPSFIIPG